MDLSQVHQKTNPEIVNELVREFANLNLDAIKSLRNHDVRDMNPELLRELRENAQALSILVFKV